MFTHCPPKRGNSTIKIDFQFKSDMRQTPKGQRVVVRIAIAAVALILMSDRASTGIEDPLRSHWKSENRGKIIFETSGIPGNWHLAFCVLNLPGKSIENLSARTRVNATGLGVRPVWGKSDKVAFVFADNELSGGRAIYELDLARGIRKTRLLLEEWVHPGTLKFSRGQLVFIRDTTNGLLVGHHPPSVYPSVVVFDYGEKSNSLYVLLSFRIKRGPPNWRIDADSLNLPSWVDSRIREKIDEGDEYWMDLVAIDSSGNVTFIREQKRTSQFSFSVSPDERFIAHTDRKRVHVYDRDQNEILVLEKPIDFDLKGVSFSPDGTRLAVSGLGKDGAGIFLCNVPGFATLEPLTKIYQYKPFDLCWSPDGKWIMLHVASPDHGLPNDLIVIEVASGGTVEIIHPYYHNGETDSTYIVHSAIDWTD